MNKLILKSTTHSDNIIQYKEDICNYEIDIIENFIEIKLFDIITKTQIDALIVDISDTKDKFNIRPDSTITVLNITKDVLTVYLTDVRGKYRLDTICKSKNIYMERSIFNNYEHYAGYVYNNLYS